jgi:hypothetical protein
MCVCFSFWTTYFLKLVYEHYATGGIIYFLISTTNDNMADAHICEIGTVLVPHTLGSWNDAWQYILEEQATFAKVIFFVECKITTWWLCKSVL